MAKEKTVFYCRSCGGESPKWEGQCRHCKEWNTYVEEKVAKGGNSLDKQQQEWRKGSTKGGPQPVALPDIQASRLKRMVTRDAELNRVLGGGIVPGSIVLFGGQPGIGKSTLLLQLALGAKARVLYVSGEESENQIKMRANRLGGNMDNCFILTETNIQKVLKHTLELEPQLLIMDSIQTMSSPNLDSMPGTVTQVRECSAELQRFAKETNIPVFLIGHITKEGSIAGPKLLEHIVDVVLLFEGDRNYTYRILRTQKNRFGSTDEMGIYEMQPDGLREVSNPSELLIAQKDDELSGSAISATIEGMRPMLIEIQALISPAVYGNPQRSATGFDLRRLGMLLAVLEKRAGFPLAQQDVFLNIAGGIKVNDPAIDLSIIAAIMSSHEDVAIPTDVCFAGEVGLSGEIRSVSRIDQRIQEADRLGFKEIFISKYNTKGLDTSRYGIKVYTIGKLQELYEELFS